MRVTNANLNIYSYDWFDRILIITNINITNKIIFIDLT